MASRQSRRRRIAYKRYKRGRQARREALLPLRDVPRHGDEPRRRVCDRRARASSGTTPRYSARRWRRRRDPGTTSFVPRPDWYFYFLFYLLRIFKWPNSVILGTVGIPTILLILALAIPVHRRAAGAAR